MSTTTTTRTDRTPNHEPRPAAPDLAPPPKLRRRPALVAGAVAAICLGALLAGWAWTATTNTQEVLVARNTIERGAIIQGDDLARVRLTADPALRPVTGSQLEEIIGRRAANDIAAGGMLTPDSITSAVVPAEGQSVVGVALTASQAPGLDLQYGDQVRVVVTPAQGADLPGGAPFFNDAGVVGVSIDEATGQTVVDVLVPQAEAAVLAARVATGNVAIVLDSRER